MTNTRASGCRRVEPGQALHDAMPVQDVVWEVDNKAITHRPDLWGHYGIAREVAVLTGRSLKPLEARVELGQSEKVVVSVDDSARCPRYTALVIEGVGGEALTTVAPMPA